MENMSVTLYVDSGQYKAVLVCPLCEEYGRKAKISLKMDGTGSWHIYGLTRHCKAFHLLSDGNTKSREVVEEEPAFKRWKAEEAQGMFKWIYSLLEALSGGHACR